MKPFASDTGISPKPVRPSPFFPEHGLIRGLAKGSKREKSRFSGGIELLTLGQITAISKPSTDLATLTEWDLTELFPALTKNLHAYYAGLYFADLLQHLISENDPHERLFQTLIKVLRALDTPTPPNSTNSNTPNPHHPTTQQNNELTPIISTCVLAFQWAILCEVGYQPLLNHDAENNTPLQTTNTTTQNHTLAFSPSAGGIVEDTGESDRWRVRAETINLLRTIQQTWEHAIENKKDTTQNEPSPHENNFVENTIAIIQNENMQSTTLGRANRLLAAYLRTILDRELPTMRFILGEIPR